MPLLILKALYWCETGTQVKQNSQKSEEAWNYSWHQAAYRYMIKWEPWRPRTQFSAAVNLFLAHRYATRLIIPLVGTVLTPLLHPYPTPLQSGSDRMIKGGPAAACQKRQTFNCASIHMVYKPLQAPGTWPQNNQASYFFFHSKNPSSAASAHWRQLDFFPPLPAVSGFSGQSSYES